MYLMIGEIRADDKDHTGVKGLRKIKNYGKDVRLKVLKVRMAGTDVPASGNRFKYFFVPSSTSSSALISFQIAEAW